MKRQIGWGGMALMASSSALASLTLYHGPHEDFMIKTQIASHQPLTVQILQGRWALVRTQASQAHTLAPNMQALAPQDSDPAVTEGWTTLPALYNNGYLTHQEYLLYKRQQLDDSHRELEWFWQSEQALGVGLRFPMTQWLNERWPKTAAEILTLWPGDQQQWVLRYHRGNQGEEAWHSVQTGFESRMAQWRGWASHVYLGAGLGLNELLSYHWDDTGASRTVPLIAAAMDVRYTLLPRLDVAVRLETSQALGSDGGNSEASHSAVSLVWILDL